MRSFNWGGGLALVSLDVNRDAGKAALASRPPICSTSPCTTVALPPTQATAQW